MAKVWADTDNPLNKQNKTKEAAGLRSAARACGQRLLAERAATGREPHAGEVRETTFSEVRETAVSEVRETAVSDRLRETEDALRLARQELLDKEEALAAQEGVIAGLRREKELQATPYTLHPTPYTLHPQP